MSTEKDCEQCGHNNKSAMAEPCRTCGIAMLNFEPRKPLTNYDRLISKTPEEMAMFMAVNADCYYCRAKDKDRCASLAHTPCSDVWLDWLKQEAKE